MAQLQGFRFDPAGYIREFLGWTPWRGQGPDRPGQIEILEAYNLALRQMHEKRDWEEGKLAEGDLLYWAPGQIIQNVIRVEAGHTVGKTKIGSGIVQHFIDCFLPSIVYTYAPSWESVKELLWKEIRSDREGKGLPGRILETCEIKISANHFAKGKATSDAGGRGTERVQGQHGEYLLFIVDEAEGVDEYVYNAIESMRSGGMVIVIMFANPRTRTSTFHKYAALSYVRSFRISCINAPNVLAGREIVPNAVKRDYVLSMTEKHCEWVEQASEDDNTFTLPFPARARNSETLMPPGTHFLPDFEFSFRVLGIAPANSADDVFVPVGRYEAATKRPRASQEPHKARLGIDVARFGNDAGTIWLRHDGAIERKAHLTKLDTNEYARAAKEAALPLKAKGVTSLHIRVDAGGGFGGGVIDKLKIDAELKAAFPDFKVLEVHNNGTPYDDQAYANLGTEMYAHAAETLRGITLVNPPDALEADLCERRYGWVNKKGVDVKALEAKDTFKREKKHSPDDGDGFALCAAPDFIFVPKAEGKTIGYNPVAMVTGMKRAGNERANTRQQRRL